MKNETLYISPGNVETFHLVKVNCGKPNCGKCPHGPYWYRHLRTSSGKTYRLYLGKSPTAADLPTPFALAAQHLSKPHPSHFAVDNHPETMPTSAT